MKNRTQVSLVSGLLAFTLLLGSTVLSRGIDKARSEATLEEVLYIPSAKAVERLSLGYSGLMANIYWTRAVQYFGGKHHEKSKQYQLLKPLLEITTTLDPHLLVAYQFGSVFLSQQPPEGAGDPQAAAELVQKGIQANPEAWRLWYDLGFIYYQEMHDPAKASEAFLKGSQVPGAYPWMKVMAAALAQDAGNVNIARYLWTNILNDAQDPMLRSNAVKRLQALRVDDEVTVLQDYVNSFREQQGHAPSGWQEMISLGYLLKIPRDPLGHPYVLHEGRVEVSNPDAIPFISKGLPPGREASLLAPIPSKKEQ